MAKARGFQEPSRLPELQKLGKPRDHEAGLLLSCWQETAPLFEAERTAMNQKHFTKAWITAFNALCFVKERSC